MHRTADCPGGGMTLNSDGSADGREAYRMKPVRDVERKTPEYFSGVQGEVQSDRGTG